MRIADKSLNLIYIKIEKLCDEIISDLHNREYLPLYVEFKNFTDNQKKYLASMINDKNRDYLSLKIIDFKTSTELSSISLGQLNSDCYANFQMVGICVNTATIEKLIRKKLKKELFKYSSHFTSIRYLPFKIQFILISFLSFMFYIWWISLKINEWNIMLFNLIQIMLVISLISIFYLIHTYKKNLDHKHMEKQLSWTIPYLIHYSEQYLKQQLKIGK